MRMFWLFLVATAVVSTVVALFGVESIVGLVIGGVLGVSAVAMAMSALAKAEEGNKGLEALQDKAQVAAHLAQVVAFLVAGGWVFLYNFVYKDLYLTRMAPMHISPSVMVSVGAAVDGRIPISTRMTLENESRNEIVVLPGLFLAWGEVLGSQWASSADFMPPANEAAGRSVDSLASRYGAPVSEIVSTGTVFSSCVLGPSEKTQKTWLFFVPEGKYDQLEVGLYLWAHNGDADLSTCAEIHDSGEYVYLPCRILSEDPWDCSPINVSGKDWARIQDEHHLWLFDAVEMVALP